MKIGIIWVGFNTEEYVEKSLAPWIEARTTKLGGHQFVICAVSVPFKGFDIGEHDSTRQLLYTALQNKAIDHLIAHDEPMAETDARGQALRWLVDAGCEILVQCDSDEFFVSDEISRILTFVENRPQIPWFRLSLKNLVFTPSQYLAEPFQPPRIHRMHITGLYIAAGFHQDNNIYYDRAEDGSRVPDFGLPCVTIPPAVAWVRHASWLNNSRSKAKVDYQLKRWGACSFKWDSTRGGLCFDESYHEQRGLSLPEVLRE